MANYHKMYVWSLWCSVYNQYHKNETLVENFNFVLHFCNITLGKGAGVFKFQRFGPRNSFMHCKCFYTAHLHAYVSKELGADYVTLC